MMKTVIFDMDGVLIDSEVIYLKSLQKYLKTLDIEEDLQTLSCLVGMNAKDITEKLQNTYHLHHISLEELMEKQDIYFDEELKETKLTPMPHLITYLEYLKAKNITLVLASSSDMHWINTVLDEINVRKYFDIIVSGESLKHSKPNPDIFYLAAEQAGCKHDECIVIEDSVNGIKAGKAANMFVIGYKGSIIQQDTSKADKEICDFCELYT